MEKRILVVDDDDSIRTLLYTVLRKQSLLVDTARNGEEALQRLQHCHYSVMLLDLMMPKKSGYEVLSFLEASNDPQHPLVIVLTAGHEPRELNPRLVAGTLRKPFEIEMLIDTIRGCLETLSDAEQKRDCPPAESSQHGTHEPE